MADSKTPARPTTASAASGPVVGPPTGADGGGTDRNAPASTEPTAPAQVQGMDMAQIGQVVAAALVAAAKHQATPPPMTVGLDEAVPGGRFIQNGMVVDCEGKPVAGGITAEERKQIDALAARPQRG